MLSTVTGCPHISDNFMPTMRTSASGALPGGAGTTTRTGRSGQGLAGCCASAPANGNAPSAAPTSKPQAAALSERTSFMVGEWISFMMGEWISVTMGEWISVTMGEWASFMVGEWISFMIALGSRGI